jgi:hypothetical protein
MTIVRADVEVSELSLRTGQVGPEPHVCGAPDREMQANSPKLTRRFQFRQPNLVGGGANEQSGKGGKGKSKRLAGDL